MGVTVDDLDGSAVDDSAREHWICTNSGEYTCL
jgi:hypothetical protein